MCVVLVVVKVVIIRVSVLGLGSRLMNMMLFSGWLLLVR